MSKKFIVFFLLGITALCLFVGKSLFRMTDTDLMEYRALMKASQPQELPPSLVHQREQVSKQFWYQQKDPLFFYIESARSELNLGEKQKVIEKLEDVRCVMQEELFYELPDGSKQKTFSPGAVAKQQVQYLEADHAIYNYASQELVANEVRLWKYCVDGHEPQTSFEGASPIMSGKAQKAEFVLKEQGVHFNADKMRMIFESKGELL